MTHAIKPFAFIFNAFFGVVVFTFAVSQSVFNFSIIGGLIRPRVTAKTSDFIVLEFTLIKSTISPVELAILSMQQAMFHLTFVSMTVTELTSTLTMIDLANLIVLFVINSIAGPV